MILPDNFLYFITLFVINVGFATYLLFTHNRTRIILFNALAFLIIAVRCCTEYYLPQIEDFETARELARWHSYIILVFGIIGACAWWYVRPFKEHPKEKIINQLFTGLVIIAYTLLIPALYLRIPFKLYPEQIDGYWQFYNDSSTWWIYYYYIINILITLVLAICITIHIVREPTKLFLKCLFLGVYLLVPISLIEKLVFKTNTDYTIPNVGVAFTLIAFASSWIFTNSRLFKDTSLDVIGETFNSISDLTIFTHIDFTVRQYNEQAANLLKLNTTNTNLASIVAGNSRMLEQAVRAFFKTLIQEEGGKQELKLIVNGESKLFLISVSKYFKSGYLFGYTFFLQDITEERREEYQLAQQNDELQALNEMKDRIFAIIGHDLRKPAIVFRGVTKKVNELLNRKDYEILNELGIEIEQEAFALNKLTDNLLSWALMQKNVMPYNPQQVNIAPVAEEVLGIFKNAMSEKTIALESNIPSNLQAYADRSAVNTIIRNLIDNAVKYTAEGGQLSVKAYEVKAGIQIEIADTGIGISKEKLKKLFALQKRKSQIGTAGEKGTGLGLYLIHELIVMNKGSVEVESELGKGTKFRIVLPSINMRLAS